MYVYKGSVTYYQNNIPFKLGKGDIIYSPIGTSRKAITYPNDLMNCFAISMKLYNFSGEIHKLPIHNITKVGVDNYLVDLFQEVNKFWLEKEEGYMLKCRAILLLIIHHIYTFNIKKKAGIYPDSRIMRVKEIILDSYSKKISLNNLAEEANLHPVYLGALFKKEVGLSIKEYINQIRIRKAKDLLISGEYMVKEVSYLCGFDDIYYFSKVFKKVVGTAPSLFVH